MKDRFALKIQTDKLEKAGIFQNDTCIFESTNKAAYEGVYAVEPITPVESGVLALARAICGPKGLYFKLLDSGEIVAVAQVVGVMLGRIRIVPAE